MSVPAGGQEPNAGGENPAAPQTPPAPTQQQPPAQAPELWEDGTPFDARKARQLVENLRNETKDLKDLRAKAKRLEELEDAGRTEAERLTNKVNQLTAEAEALRSENRRIRVEREVERQARDLGFTRPDDALAFLDLGRLEYDDEGNPKGVKKALETILEGRPYLKAAVSTSAAGTSPSAPRPNGSPGGGDLAKQKEEALRASGRYAV